MKLMTLAAALFMVLCMTSGNIGAHAERQEKGALTKHFEKTLFAVSEKGQVSVEVLLDDKEYRIGRDMIGIVVHDSHDEDVEDARLTITISGLTEPLIVKEKGGGLYVFPAERLPKAGKWEMKIAVKKKKIDDSAIFSFPEALEKRLPAGKYSADMLKDKK